MALPALSVLLALPLLCGCASPTVKTTQAPERYVPSAWRIPDYSLSAAAPDLKNWWVHFGDPVLTGLVQRALAANTSISAARASVLQAYALRDVSRAALAPQANASLAAQRNTLSGAPVATATNTLSAALNATWAVDLFGSRQRAVDASVAAAQASTATLADSQSLIAQELAAGFIALRASQLRLSIARQNAASQSETLQITLWRLQAGLVAQTDVAQARAALEQTYALLPMLQSSIERGATLLATLANLNAAEISSLLVAPELPVVPMAEQDGIRGSPQDTLQRRADVRAAQFQVTRALALIAQTQAERLPALTLGASLGSSANSPAALRDNATTAGTLSATMTLPLMDGGAAQAQVRAQEAALDLARSNYQSAVATALQEVEDATTALRTDRERVQRLRNAAAAATEAADLALSRYSSGLVDFQVVLETQRTQRNTQDSVASASADLGIDQVHMFRALGAGWEPGSQDEGSAQRPVPFTLETSPSRAP